MMTFDPDKIDNGLEIPFHQDNRRLWHILISKIKLLSYESIQSAHFIGQIICERLTKDLPKLPSKYILWKGISLANRIGMEIDLGTHLLNIKFFKGDISKGCHHHHLTNSWLRNFIMTSLSKSINWSCDISHKEG